MADTPIVKGRGAASNPSGRFERLAFVPEADDDGNGRQTTRPTECYRDTSKTILAFNDSPDVPMDASVNPYRGCEHGCIYCYARPYHEYLGLSAGTDFESRIFVKENAAALLREALSSKSWKPQVIGLSGVTDPYQPIERTFRITRACLEVLREFLNPVGVITKNHLVTRDIDVLAPMAEHGAAAVFLSITTLDDDLARTMEPRASRPALRLDAIRKLRAAGIPAGVMVAPIIPGLTDHEVPAILAAAADAGAMTAGRTVVRLPHGVKELFAEWLETHMPLRKEKVLGRLRDVRDGKLTDASFGSRMTGEGAFAESIHQMFELHRRRLGLTQHIPLSTKAFRRAAGSQLDLFSSADADRAAGA